MDIEQTMDIDEIPFNKLQIGQDDLKDEPLEVIESLVPPPQMMETSDKTAENTNGEELMEVEESFRGRKKNMRCSIEYTWTNSVMRRTVTQTLTIWVTHISNKDMNNQRTLKDYFSEL